MALRLHRGPGTGRRGGRRRPAGRRAGRPRRLRSPRESRRRRGADRLGGGRAGHRAGRPGHAGGDPPPPRGRQLRPRPGPRHAVVPLPPAPRPPGRPHEAATLVPSAHHRLRHPVPRQRRAVRGAHVPRRHRGGHRPRPRGLRPGRRPAAVPGERLGVRGTGHRRRRGGGLLRLARARGGRRPLRPRAGPADRPVPLGPRRRGRPEGPLPVRHQRGDPQAARRVLHARLAGRTRRGRDRPGPAVEAGAGPRLRLRDVPVPRGPPLPRRRGRGGRAALGGVAGAHPPRLGHGPAPGGRHAGPRDVPAGDRPGAASRRLPRPRAGARLPRGRGAVAAGGPRPVHRRPPDHRRGGRPGAVRLGPAVPGPPAGGPRAVQRAGRRADRPRRAAGAGLRGAAADGRLPAVRHPGGLPRAAGRDVQDALRTARPGPRPHLGLLRAEPGAAVVAGDAGQPRGCAGRQPPVAGLPLHVGVHAADLPGVQRGAGPLARREGRHASGPLGAVPRPHRGTVPPRGRPLRVRDAGRRPGAGAVQGPAVRPVPHGGGRTADGRLRPRLGPPPHPPAHLSDQLVRRLRHPRRGPAAAVGGRAAMDRPPPGPEGRLGGGGTASHARGRDRPPEQRRRPHLPVARPLPQRGDDRPADAAFGGAA